MRRIFLNAITAIAAVVLLTSCSEEQVQYRELQKIKRQYVSVLANGGKESQELVKILKSQTPEERVSDQVTVDVQQRYPADAALCEELLNTLNEDGSWDDINYADESYSGWDLKRHADRAVILAKLYASKECPKELKTRTEAAIHKIFNYWFENKFVCGNWWYNEVGIPKTLGEAFIIFEDRMSEEEKELAVEIVMKPAQRRLDYHVGQNLVWVRGNVLIEALLTNDYELAKECRDVIENEITTVRAEGIKPDWSFHQHGAMQQFGNYGLSYLMSTALYANIFNNTSLAFSPEKVDILVNFIGEGYRWVAWRGMFDINSLTRQLYHNAQRDKMMGTALSAALLKNVGGKRSQEVYKHLFTDNYLETDKNSLVGNKYFWSSDCAVERSEEWFASLRCSSSRIIATECVNNENCQGYNLAIGSLFLYVDGYEFENSFPFWDWNKIPGTTTYTTSKSLMPNKKQNNTSAFVGGASDGVQSISVMDFDKLSVKAHKAWVMDDEFVLCVGGEISSKEGKILATTIDQRPKKGDLKLLVGGEWFAIDEQMEVKGGRYFHNNIGYISLCDSQSVTLTSQSQSGSWNDIVRLYDDKEESMEMVTIEISHGKHVKGGKYAYLMLPNTTEDGVKAFDSSRINIAQNDAAAQIIEIDRERAFIAAYEPIETTILGGVEFSTQSPALYIVAKSGEGEYQVTIAEPTQLLDGVEATLAGKAIKVEIAEQSRGESFTQSVTL